MRRRESRIVQVDCRNALIVRQSSQAIPAKIDRKPTAITIISTGPFDPFRDPVSRRSTGYSSNTPSSDERRRIEADAAKRHAGIRDACIDRDRLAAA